MKLLLTISFLVVSRLCFGQETENSVYLKQTPERHLPYYSPSFYAEAYHRIVGIGNLRMPTGSISRDKILMTGLVELELEDTLVQKSEQPTNTLTLLIDTSLYTSKEVELFETFKLNKHYNSYPRAIRVKRNGKLYTTPLKMDTNVQVIAQPVFIANTSTDFRYLIGYSGHLLVTQQAKDNKGEWKDIEISVPGGCGMVRYICELKPNDFVLTTVYRFKGNFKTQLRVKLETTNHTFYSDPFVGYINYEQLYNPKIKFFDNTPYERL